MPPVQMKSVPDARKVLGEQDVGDVVVGTTHGLIEYFYPDVIGAKRRIHSREANTNWCLEYIFATNVSMQYLVSTVDFYPPFPRDEGLCFTWLWHKDEGRVNVTALL